MLPFSSILLKPLPHKLILTSHLEDPLNSMLHPQEIALILANNFLYECLQPLFCVLLGAGAFQ